MHKRDLRQRQRQKQKQKRDKFFPLMFKNF